MKQNSFFYDFGKAAFATLDLELESVGTTEVEAVIGECLKDGKVDRAPGGCRYINVQKITLSPGRKVYRYPLELRPPTCKGGLISPLPGEEIAPFRYVEVTGACKVHSCVRHEVFPPEFHDEEAVFSSSDDDLNRVWEFCKYSIKATAAFGLFIDGERERLPYEGDAYINQLGWFCCCADPRIPRDTIAHLLENPTWPSEWQLLMPIVARDYLLYTGDDASIRKWLPVLEERLLGPWIGEDGLLYADEHNPRDIVDWPLGERDGYEFGATNLVPNCYRYGALLAMAELTGEERYRQSAAALRETIRNTMLKGNVFTDSPGSSHSALHSKFFPLFFGVGSLDECAGIPEAGMRCSVYGAQFLLDAMFRNGMSESALVLLRNRGDRGWLNMMTLGSTITMEAWSNEYKPNQDWNHAWGAAPANIIPRFVAGVRPLEPGFRRFAVDPHPCDVKSFFFRMPIVGNRSVEVEYDKGKIRIQVPEGTAAVCGGKLFEAGRWEL